jgi:two-component system response regulator PilR (NtrC family)
MAKPVALVVDDEPDIRTLLEITLGRMQVACVSCADLAEARSRLAEGRYDVCLTDMRLPDGDGIDLVRLIGERYPELPVAVITAHGSMESAIAALKAGAFDFVSKPVDLGILRRLIDSALRLRQPPAAAPRAPASGGLPALLGDSSAMAQVRALIAKLARSQAPVHVSGESGTGKELAARLIHALGPRADRPFVPVNCGAIPHDLIESELFGHVKGSFTGASADKAGLFQAADGGTLFLDEIADLPLALQVKLLRAIQEKAVRPVGAAREVPVDVRVVSATHKDLGALVAAGEFRQDLYYRINVIGLHMPPLRERSEDAPPLVTDILGRLAVAQGRPVPGLEPAALRRLVGYGFPGNVRELENVLERAMALCEGDRITENDLGLPESVPGSAESREAAAPAMKAPGVEATPSATQGATLDDHLEDVERQAILKVLEETRWNRTAAAKKLGISFRQLRYRLEKLGL